MRKLVLASHNKGKLAELQDLMAPHGIEVLSSVELNLPDVEETGTTFQENAALKAQAAAQASGLPCLADDSGLCVEALDGRPGVYSARYAVHPETGERDFGYAMEKLWSEVKQCHSERAQRCEESQEIHSPREQGSLAQDDVRAAFVTVLVLADANGDIQYFEGRCEGTLCWPPRGTQGFGYDPMFIPAGEARTFGEMNADEKKQFSHRAKAFEKLEKSL